MRTTATAVLVALLLFGSASALAQFKSQIPQENRVGDGMDRGGESSLFLFGWFNPEKFHMRHSFSLQYMTMGGQGLSLGTYTNSMMYEFSDKLNARADVSFSYSPYNSFGSFGKKNDFSSIYLSRAQLDYRPWENVRMQLQFRQVPYGVSPYYSPFYNPWSWEDGF